ncbi:MAG: DUF423 domain-containing protein, partial [Pseudomonadota bacterium]
VLFVGALLGFLSVVIGASVEHVVKPNVEPEVFRWTMTAIRYHQIGALAVFAIGLGLAAGIQASLGKWLKIAAWLFVTGTVLFSFSIYLTAITGVEKLTYITPVGGTVLMAAWASAAWGALRYADKGTGSA